MFQHLRELNMSYLSHWASINEICAVVSEDVLCLHTPCHVTLCVYEYIFDKRIRISKSFRGREKCKTLK